MFDGRNFFTLKFESLDFYDDLYYLVFVSEFEMDLVGFVFVFVLCNAF